MAPYRRFGNSMERGEKGLSELGPEIGPQLQRTQPNSLGVIGSVKPAPSDTFRLNF